ncbi:MAG: hypothetical protein JNK59_02450 [Sterolibacteriaceae bacterium]|nr:hypothetical protein [Sterolibacteriaceae bacterium]
MVWAKADSTRPSTIVENAGDEPSVATAKVESDKRNLDYNAATGAVGARLEMNYSVRRGKRPHAGESRTIRRRAAFFGGAWKIALKRVAARNRVCAAIRRIRFEFTKVTGTL